ncbi:MAG: c-type cytochrome biogenesis protein CcmI [Woeseiaceae bacterium]
MIMFWVFAIAMVVIAMVFILRPLLLELNKNDADRTAQNVAITKERLKELEVELEQDTITQAEYDQTKEELEQALLNDVEGSNIQEQSSSNKSYTRFSRYALIFSVPVLAVGFYIYLGSPNLIDGASSNPKQAAAPAGHSASSNAKQATVEDMLVKLEKKLAANPDNAEGWYMLGRSYMSMSRYPEAEAAFAKTNELVPNNPTIMLQYADSLTMSNGGRITGKPFELIKRAVEQQPNNVTGLWLLGMGYEEQGKYKKAISYWKLLVGLLKDNKSIDEVQKLIRQAKIKAGIKTTDVAAAVIKKPAVVNASLTVSVSLDKEMLGKVSMDDTVFIFAKAVSGPPMPLAVSRKQVKDLPIVVTLDDSMAMIPSMKLSGFKQVKISARISKSGNPIKQKGDLQSKVVVVNSNQKEMIKLNISKSAP